MLEDLGQMRPLNSIYTLALRRIRKKNSNVCNHVATFKAINGQTKKDKDFIMTNDDFTSELHGTTILSHIDLVKVLNLLFSLVIKLHLLPRIIIKLLSVYPFSTLRLFKCNLICAIFRADFRDSLIK